MISIEIRKQLLLIEEEEEEEYEENDDLKAKHIYSLSHNIKN